MNEINSETTVDPTEDFRRNEIKRINSDIESNEKATERARLESIYPQVWDTSELGNDFEVQSFMAPYVIVRRKSDDCRGSLQFQHSPRFYFNFQSV